MSNKDIGPPPNAPRITPAGAGSKKASNKFTSPEKAPEGIVAELLICLIEELHEIGQRVCKAQRFGLAEIQKGQSLTNEERIVYECADLEAVIEMLHDHGVLEAKQPDIDEMKKLKRQKLERYLQNV